MKDLFTPFFEKCQAQHVTRHNFMWKHTGVPVATCNLLHAAMLYLDHNASAYLRQPNELLNSLCNSCKRADIIIYNSCAGLEQAPYSSCFSALAYLLGRVLWEFNPHESSAFLIVCAQKYCPSFVPTH